MPELPEVETVRRGIEPVLAGRRITQLTVADPRLVLRSPLPSDLLVGATVGAVRRRGKWLLLDTDASVTGVLHLRMSGQVLLGAAPDGERPARFTLTVDDGTTLRFVDQRRFGELLVFDDGGAAAFEARIGPDADTIDVRRLRRALSGRTGRLKGALTNQSIVAGIGNIYADESLWRARLSPERPAGGLDDAELHRLAAAIRRTLRAALDAGGTSARDGLYVNADGEEGWFAVRLEAYQRDGEPCRRCGNPIVRAKTGATSTHWCPTCQL